MKRISLAFSILALCGATLISTAAFAAAPAGPPPAGAPVRLPGVQSSGATQKPMISCSRIGLQYAAQQYVAGQAKGDYSALPLANGLGYWEQMKAADIKTGFLTKKLNINRSFAIFDEDSCQTYVEIMVTDKAEPYVAGVRMRVTYDKIAEIDIIYETTGYWLFNADDYLKYASMEDWGPVAPSNRSTRGELVFAANAYLDAFLEAKIDAVPWGYPCVRIEGGMYTGSRDGSPTRLDASCSAGVPSGVNIANRRFVVDEVLNTVLVYCTFGAGGPSGGSGAPDAHMFRLENGKLRYVHTLTALLQSAGPGAAPRAPGAGPAGAPRAGPGAPAPAAPGGN
ncbi:MAG: hypothetical protein ABIQ86_09565 [Steroidobacteraceae bacterium]